MRNLFSENKSRLSVVLLSFVLDLLGPDIAAPFPFRTPGFYRGKNKRETKTINIIHLFVKSRQRVKLHDLGVIFL